MAQSSYGTYLLEYDATANSNAGGYKKVIDIVDYSDLEEQPDTLDTTTLSDDMETSIPSIKRLGGGVSFTVNLIPSEFLALRAVAEAHTLKEYALLFKNEALEVDANGVVSNFTPDTTGSTANADFAVYFDATSSIVQNGAGVDEVLRATLTLFPQGKDYTIGGNKVRKVMSYIAPIH